jgi:hypothetical protein
VEAVPPLASLADSLVVALVGFVGVVVGGLINWAAQRAAARHRDRGETLSAARLVDADLAHALAIIEGAFGPPQRFSPALAAKLETPAWAARQGALALGLDRNQWDEVRDAFASIAVLRLALEESLGGARDPSSEGREALERIRVAQRALKPL